MPHLLLVLLPQLSIGQCFPLIFDGIKGYSFAIFAGVAVLAFVFTYFKVPETKGRSLEDIVRCFEKKPLEFCYVAESHYIYPYKPNLK
jgi:hypothetical protein